ncbi:hypothetical protein Leryth_022824 [Lithospermum erythrorhizon]|nr:hypothetical protein Leryth_022824 [Lithospermum erythrorhizon]
MDKKMNWIRGECIGRGAFGTVNLAINKDNGSIFAVKSVDKLRSLPSQLEALENEIRILGKISSPFVVEYLDDDITSETTSYYRNLHIEYMPGGTVADVAKFSDNDFPEEIVRCYTWCIVSALDYLHNRGVIHCDVKGQNILVGPTMTTAKLADFGSAIEVVGSHMPRGSPLWMAPEVVRGEYQGPESDVWSLGCTVIEMITGKPPWQMGGAAADMLCRIGCSAEVPVVPARLSDIGKDFLDKCLKREYNERWSCDQLLKHPFLLPCAQFSGVQCLFPSPRGVLEWFSSDIEDEDEDEKNGLKL